MRTELIHTIRLVHNGHRRIPPELAQRIAEHAADDAITLRNLTCYVVWHKDIQTKSSLQIFRYPSSPSRIISRVSY
ncbi:DNA-binding NarL/FixJ family response regulator [Edaphobacter lichenicola]|uniref:DNA-binding NarL/FixJ family response regulator n=1 Tax=Tunturiibacter lichenicola TaxID=2051959 RepID=A0A7W8J7Y0_9BACT|nr:DNA-binding NarL/FixJ family response regulator [Edaphobacter lichenicola]